MKLGTQERKNKARKITNEERAIRAHEGFITYVLGKTRVAGLNQVFEDPALEGLKRLYLRVIGFAEDVQLKRIPLMPPLVDQSTHHHLTFVVPPERATVFEDRAKTLSV